MWQKIATSFWLVQMDCHNIHIPECLDSEDTFVDMGFLIARRRDKLKEKSKTLQQEWQIGGRQLNC